jgi:hypothetical protein
MFVVRDFLIHQVYTGLTQLLASQTVRDFDPSCLEFAIDESTGEKKRIEASPEEWLNLSPQEVDDLIAQKQGELDAYLTRKKQRRGETANEKSDSHVREDQSDESESDEEALNGEENPIDRLAKSVKQFVQNTSSYEGVHSKDFGKKSKPSAGGFDDSSSEDESDEFYRYAFSICS